MVSCLGCRGFRNGRWIGSGPVYSVNRSLSPQGLLVLLTGLNLVNYLDRYVVSAVLTPMQAEFHLNDGQLGLINSIFAGITMSTLMWSGLSPK